MRLNFADGTSRSGRGSQDRRRSGCEDPLLLRECSVMATYSNLCLSVDVEFSGCACTHATTTISFGVAYRGGDIFFVSIQSVSVKARGKPKMAMEPSGLNS